MWRRWRCWRSGCSLGRSIEADAHRPALSYIADHVDRLDDRLGDVDAGGGEPRRLLCLVGQVLGTGTENSSMERASETEAIATIAVFITAFGMVCDFSGEGSAILLLVEHYAARSIRDRTTSAC